MALSKRERAALEFVVRRLQGEHCSSEVAAHLKDDRVRIYLDTWVTGAIRAILRGEGRLALGLAEIPRRRPPAQREESP